MRVSRPEPQHEGRQLLVGVREPVSGPAEDGEEGEAGGACRTRPRGCGAPSAPSSSGAGGCRRPGPGSRPRSWSREWNVGSTRSSRSAVAIAAPSAPASAMRRRRIRSGPFGLTGGSPGRGCGTARRPGALEAAREARLGLALVEGVVERLGRLVVAGEPLELRGRGRVRPRRATGNRRSCSSAATPGCAAARISASTAAVSAAGASGRPGVRGLRLARDRLISSLRRTTSGCVSLYFERRLSSWA
jgi:hypothetical protein